MSSSQERLEALARRVADLTAAQRTRLAELLDGAGAEAGRTQLVAYLTAAGEPPGADDLVPFLAERLPRYMIPSRFVLVDRLPTTSAGKVDRRRVGGMGGDDVASRPAGMVAPRNARERELATIWVDVLGFDEISVYDDFFEIGGDSLLSIRVLSRARRAGITISPEAFFEDPTIATLATLDGKAPSEASQEAVTGSAPLTPIQHWFRERITAGASQWNQGVLLDVPAGVPARAIEDAVAALVNHHDALRLRIAVGDEGPRQEFDVPPAAPPFETVELSAPEGEERNRELTSAADRVHGSLDPAEGRLFRAALFEGDAGFRKLLLVAHHLVVDGVSWGILLEDLSSLVARPAGDAGVSLPRKTVSAKAWAEALAVAASDPELAHAVERWTRRRTPHDGAVEAQAPAGVGRRDVVATAERHELALAEDATSRLLERARGGAQSTVQELILAAWLLAWCRWSGTEGLLVDVEGHGRDALGRSVDVSRTVGWFTTVFPVMLPLEEVTAAAAQRAVREALRALPMGGAAHGLARYLSPDDGLRAALADAPRARVLFNYLGSADDLVPPESPFMGARQGVGQERSPDAVRAYPVEVNARLEDRALHVHIEYSPSRHSATSMADLGRALRRALVELADGEEASGSAYDLADLDEAGLQQVADLLSKLDGG